jgi:hypothetical protein
MRLRFCFGPGGDVETDADPNYLRYLNQAAWIRSLAMGRVLLWLSRSLLPGWQASGEDRRHLFKLMLAGISSSLSANAEGRKKPPQGSPGSRIT